jgi:hypothetical protein
MVLLSIILLILPLACAPQPPRRASGLGGALGAEPEASSQGDRPGSGGQSAQVSRSAGVPSRESSRLAWEPSRLTWEPSRSALEPGLDPLGRMRAGRASSPTRKFSLRFYQNLRAQLRIAPLVEVDIWDLRFYPRRYDIITLGPVSIRQFSGRKELLENLATTHGMTKDKAQILINWVKSGGMVWIEYGVFVQRYELIQQEERAIITLPDLTGFTIFGLPTRAFIFEAQVHGTVAVEPRLYSFRNEAQHEVSADIHRVQLLQSDVQTLYPIIDSTEGELIREQDNVYARVVNFGEGKIISTVPFETWDVEADGEKFRINLLEWLGGFPVPIFAPVVEVERAGE